MSDVIINIFLCLGSVEKFDAADMMPNFNPIMVIMVEGYAALFSCTAAVQASNPMTVLM